MTLSKKTIALLFLISAAQSVQAQDNVHQGLHNPTAPSVRDGTLTLLHLSRTIPPCDLKTALTLAQANCSIFKQDDRGMPRAASERAAVEIESIYSLLKTGEPAFFSTDRHFTGFQKIWVDGNTVFTVSAVADKKGQIVRSIAKASDSIVFSTCALDPSAFEAALKTANATESCSPTELKK